MECLSSFATSGGNTLSWQFLGLLPTRGRFALAELRDGDTLEHADTLDLDEGYTMPYGWRAAVFCQFRPSQDIVDERRARRELEVQQSMPGMLVVVAVPGLPRGGGTTNQATALSADVPELPTLNPLLTYSDLTVFSGAFAGSGDGGGDDDEQEQQEQEQERAAIASWKTAVVDYIAAKSQIPAPQWRGVLCKVSFVKPFSRLAASSTPWSDELARQSVGRYLSEVDNEDRLSETDVQTCSAFVHVYNTLEHHMVLLQHARGYRAKLDFEPITVERLAVLWHMRVFPSVNAPAADRWASPVVAAAIHEWLSVYERRCSELNEGGTRATRFTDMRDGVLLAWSSLASAGPQMHKPSMYLYHAYNALNRVFTAHELHEYIINPASDLTRSWAATYHAQFGVLATHFEWPNHPCPDAAAAAADAAPPPIEYWRCVRRVTSALNQLSHAKTRDKSVLAYKHPWVWWSQRQHWTAQTDTEPCVPFLLWQLKMGLKEHSATVDVPTVLLPLTSSAWQEMDRLLWYIWAVESTALLASDTAERMWTASVSGSGDNDVEFAHETEQTVAPMLLHWVKGSARVTFVPRETAKALVRFVRATSAAQRATVPLDVCVSLWHPANWVSRISVPRRWPVLYASHRIARVNEQQPHQSAPRLDARTQPSQMPQRHVGAFVNDDYAFAEALFALSGARGSDGDNGGGGGGGGGSGDGVVAGAVVMSDIRTSAPPLAALLSTCETIQSVFEAAPRDASDTRYRLVLLAYPFWTGHFGASWEHTFLSVGLCNKSPPCLLPAGVTALSPQGPAVVPPPAVFTVYDYFTRCHLVLTLQQTTALQFWTTVFTEMPWPVVVEPVTDGPASGLGATTISGATARTPVYHYVRYPFVSSATTGRTNSGADCVFVYDLTVDEPAHPLALVNALMEGAAHTSIQKVKVHIKIRATPGTGADTGVFLLRGLVNTWMHGA